MRKVFKLLQAIVLTSTIALVPVACKKETQINYTNISNINLDPINAPVSLDKATTYDAALANFKKIVQIQISKLVKTEKAPQYGSDYKFTIINSNHKLYDYIDKLELLNINVQASITTHILKGKFTAQVNLVNKPKSIDQLTVDTQKFDHSTSSKPATFQDAIDSVKAIIDKKIKSVDVDAMLDRDYVINVEGHNPSELITAKYYGNNNINVNAISDDTHHLLVGAFNFILTIT